MDVYAFGRELVRTRDLDPVYVCVYEAALEPEVLKKWLVAYWCFYHMGTASWISTRRDYWGAMELAAGTKAYPRGRERRHYRGENARKSVAFLKEQDLDGLWDELGRYRYERGRIRLGDLVDYFREWVGFGPWIAFKAADMVERLGILEVDFSDASAYLYDSPAKGAAVVWGEENDGEPPPDVSKWAVARVVDELGDLKAPPGDDRPFGPPEAETVLCKYAAARSGHYRIGEDVEACRTALLRFPSCSLSQRLLRGGGKGGMW